MKEKQSSNPILNWWKKNYVYVVSSLLVIAVVMTVLALKHFWPFGKAMLLNGDYISQTWPFLVELKEKLATGEGLVYTWNAGFGTNFLSIISFGLINPMLIIFLLVPNDWMLQTGTIVYILALVGMNCSMLYYLNHRPGERIPKNKLINMLFSMSYALCIYVIANANIWYFMVCAIFFPLIILGLENFVANKGWKLYFISLAAAFISNYYFAGLFCFFIIFYYLTLQFGSFKIFLKKSLKIAGISIAAIASTGVLLLPTAVQMMNQDYTTSEMTTDIWFTNYFDIFKNFLIFNKSIGAGTTMTSYGEVSLYFGLLPLMLASFYFLNPKIKRSVRLKKLAVAGIYLLAFNLNGLNYVLHLFHYPTWYPNRFSLFFVFYCVILAYESWATLEKTDFKYLTVLRGVIVGIVWAVMAVLCFAFANEVEYQFTYYYSIMIFMFYMVAMLLLPYLKGKEARILAGIGCLELLLSFAYTGIFRSAAISLVDYNTVTSETEEYLDGVEMEETNGFSRILDAKCIMQANAGLRFGLKTPSIFASSINNSLYFYTNVGIVSGGNSIWSFAYSPATMSLLNIEYVFIDTRVAALGKMESIYSANPNVYDNYPVHYEEDEVYIYHNPTVLSVAYMIDSEAEDAFDESMLNFKETGLNVSENVNHWVEEASGVSGVFEPVEAELYGLESVNCIAGVMDNSLLVSKEMLEGVDMNQEGAISAIPEAEYDETLDSFVIVKYIAQEDGEYFVQLGNVMSNIGYVEAGEEFAFIRKIEREKFMQYEYEANNIEFYKFNEEKWLEAYDILSQQQLEVTEYDSDTIIGTVNAKEDGILFTSIAYDENWHMYVDGEEVEILPLWNKSLVAAKVPAGEHEIRLEYRQKGLVPGIVLSVLVILLLILYCLYTRKTKKDYLLENSDDFDDAKLSICYTEQELEIRKKPKSVEDTCVEEENAVEADAAVEEEEEDSI
ncbi:MAG: YfhO family protein [Lachnospiraceae bacterium]|nr:YfhO family protein [Lachnospiraceae bacterium]